MKVEQSEYGQIVFFSKDDFVDEGTFSYIKMIGIGAISKMAVLNFKTILTDPDPLSEDKHLIFTVQEVWNALSASTQKAIMDHEFGHIADGQMDSETMKAAVENGGGAIVIPEWEFAADDFSAERNTKEGTLKALLECTDLFSKDAMYTDLGIKLKDDPVISARLKRLGYEAAAEATA